MKCVIPGAGIKAFGKAIFCLSKIGEELFIERLDEGLALKTVNTARSAFACFLFERKFFISYRDAQNGCGTDSQEEGRFKCKIPTRSVLSVFRALHTLERTVDRCTLYLDLDENKLVFVFHCKHGVVKTHSLGYQECEALQAVFSKDLCPNHLSAPARTLSEVVTHLPSSLEEVTLIALPTSITLRNYVEDEGDGNRPSLTEISLAPEEFDHYQVGVDAAITFCLKELRAILTFTDAIHHSLTMRFEEPGRPIVLSIEDGGVYKADFVMATLLDSNSTHQHTTHNQTSYEDSTIVQNQTNGLDSLNNEPSTVHSPKRTRPNTTIRTHSASTNVDFPSGSQFNRHSSKTEATSSVNVPSPPNEADLMDIRLDPADTERQVGTQSESYDSETRKQSMAVSESHSSIRKSPITDKPSTSVATRIDTNTMADGFDVMDALFGVEEFNDIDDEGNQFGFGVERESAVRGQEEECHERAVEMMDNTQDSIINDSGFLPRSPPAKKPKLLPYSALLGLTMFSSEHNRSEVLAPDSDDEK